MQNEKETLMGLISDTFEKYEEENKILNKGYQELIETYNKGIDKINEISTKASKNDGFESLEELYEYVRGLENCLNSIQDVLDKTTDNLLILQNGKDNSYEEDSIGILDMLDFDIDDESSDENLERVSEDDDIVHYVQNPDINDESSTKEDIKDNLAMNNLKDIISSREEKKTKNSTEKDAASYFNLEEDDL